MSETARGQVSRPTLFERYALDRLEAGDLETLRLILRGGSVIDWKRLHFKTRGEVDHFLRTNLFDPDDPIDVRRMREILRQAVEYLRKTFRYRVAEPVAKPRGIQDLFLLASGVLEPTRLRRIACVVLKVMHTVQHVEARELLHRARVSEVEIAQMVDHRVRGVVERLVREERLPIVEFDGSAKSRHSVVTKLIAKRENVAAQVYDRHRYRVVVEDLASVVTVVLVLAHEMFPFNYVVPGQAQNTLVSLSELGRAHPRLRELARAHPDGSEDDGLRQSNEFSGRSYRILNFIVDLPLRIDATALATKHERDDDLGRIVFAPVELQVVDKLTAHANEEGENAHVRYKKRQLRQVLSRLSRGLVVPRRRKAEPDGNGAG